MSSNRDIRRKLIEESAAVLAEFTKNPKFSGPFFIGLAVLEAADVIKDVISPAKPTSIDKRILVSETLSLVEETLADNRGSGPHNVAKMILALRQCNMCLQRLLEQ